MNQQQREQILHELAAAIARRRLTTAARVFLDIATPLGFLASQIALFARPLTPHGRWQNYIVALGEEDSWKVLQRIVAQREC